MRAYPGGLIDGSGGSCAGFSNLFVPYLLILTAPKIFFSTSFSKLFPLSFYSPFSSLTIIIIYLIVIMDRNHFRIISTTYSEMTESDAAWFRQCFCRPGDPEIRVPGRAELILDAPPGFVGM